MSVAFWSAEIKAGKPAEVQPPEGYVLNIQNAALAVDSADAKGSLVLKAQTVSIEGDKLNAVLGTLRTGSCEQFNLGKKDTSFTCLLATRP